MHVALLSHGDKAGLICQLYEAGDRHVWYSNVPGEGEEMLRLSVAAVEAVMFGSPVPTSHHNAWELRRYAEGPPVEVDYERQPTRLEESYRWDRTIRHFSSRK